MNRVNREGESELDLGRGKNYVLKEEQKVEVNRKTTRKAAIRKDKCPLFQTSVRQKGCN